MGIGTLRCVVINVTDLQLAYEFWSEVTGLEVIGSEDGWHGWLGYLGHKDPWKHEASEQEGHPHHQSGTYALPGVRLPARHEPAT